MKPKYNIEINYERDSLFDEISLSRLRDSYMTPDEQSPQERYAYVSAEFASDLQHAQRLYDYASQHWFGYATPILSYGRNRNGLPISCFLNYVEDTRDGLVDNLSETNTLSMMGGGVGVYWSTRGRDEKSTGVIPHMKIYDDSVLAYKQGSTRRGSYAMYLDISHPDIIEFLEMRKETGDQRRKCLNIHHGVNIPDEFMHIIERCMDDPNADDSWELKDPKSGKVHRIVSAKELWVKILELRAGVGRGEPYIHYIDNTNRAIPQYLKDQGYYVNQSNLCTEILEHTDKDQTAVCCLSSLNLEKWDEYKDNYQFFKDILEMLDNVLETFIIKARSEPKISRASLSAYLERSVGLGVMGFHSYLQSKYIPFESALAVSANHRIFSTIREYVDQANYELGKERGNNIRYKNYIYGDEVYPGSPSFKRFTMTMAIAPTATNSLICGNVSPSIEPWRANAFRQDTLSGTFIQKNKYLDGILKPVAGDEGYSIEKYNSIWKDIIHNEGSIQNLDYFDDSTKSVFKTASEIDNFWILQHAADRQQYIDQGQSLNLFIKPDCSIKRLHFLHFRAWQKGLKTLYYLRTEKLANTEKVSSKVEREIIEEYIPKADECLACEG